MESRPSNILLQVAVSSGWYVIHIGCDVLRLDVWTPRRSIAVRRGTLPLERYHEHSLAPACLRGRPYVRLAMRANTSAAVYSLASGPSRSGRHRSPEIDKRCHGSRNGPEMTG